MDENLSHQELKRLHDEAKKVVAERQKLYSRRQLSNTLTKKFKTTIIGAIASFEEGFGYLWGHGKPIDELSENEVEYKKEWEQTRTNILNKGNSQLRAALEEINNYELSWKRYRTELILKDRGDNDE